MLYILDYENGEILSLRYSDIDFNNKTISVKRTLYWKEKKFTEPKSKNSIRTVPVPDSLIKLIDNKKSSELIFTNDGDIYSPKRLQKKWNNFCKKENVQVKRFHSLRHTFATLLINKGVPLTIISKLLGHSYHHTTLLYAHISPEVIFEVKTFFDKMI